MYLCIVDTNYKIR